MQKARLTKTSFFLSDFVIVQIYVNIIAFSVDINKIDHEKILLVLSRERFTCK